MSSDVLSDGKRIIRLIDLNPVIYKLGLFSGDTVVYEILLDSDLQLLSASDEPALF